MVNIFFSFMGRRYPPSSLTSYVEQPAQVPVLTVSAPGFPAW
jgi:hypothetical protein